MSPFPVSCWRPGAWRWVPRPFRINSTSSSSWSAPLVTPRQPPAPRRRTTCCLQKACASPATRSVEIPGPPTTRVAHFSHQQHLKMGNIAPVIAAAIDKNSYLQPVGNIRSHLNGDNPCEACHRGIGESAQVSPANMPQMADCIVCHSQIDNPFSCEKCHAKGDNLKPASHVEGFMSAHSSGTMNLDKASCIGLPRPEFPLSGLPLVRGYDISATPAGGICAPPACAVAHFPHTVPRQIRLKLKTVHLLVCRIA